MRDERGGVMRDDQSLRSYIQSIMIIHHRLGVARSGTGSRIRTIKHRRERRVPA